MSEPDWRPTADWPLLRRRAELLREVRRFFDSRGFLEVETPLVSRDTVVDRHLDPLELTVDAGLSAYGAPRLFLQTSPEFAMKRLLAAGADAIYQVARAFRGGEHGRRHNPEFTMLEWYRRDDRPEQAMDLLSDLAETLLNRGPAERLTYREAFLQHAAVDPHAASADELAGAARRLTLPPADLGLDVDAWRHYLLSEAIEPHLGRRRPLILHDYPASQAALAETRRGADGLEVAERFELYVDGCELANGYHELRDPAELTRRARETNRRRREAGAVELPETSRLTAAMEAGLPPCCGVALGFDRLVMIATGAADLSQVLAFPAPRA